MSPALCDVNGVIVVDGEENMGYVCEIGEGVLRAYVSAYSSSPSPSPQPYLDRPWIGCLHEHKRHGRAKEDDVRVFEVDEVFALQISITSDFGLDHMRSRVCPLLFPKRNDLCIVKSASQPPNLPTGDSATNIVCQPVIL